MYQVHESGPRLIQFFSRTRRDKERKTPISSCHMEMLGLKSMTYAFIEMLRQCVLPVTVVTDSRSVVKVFQHYQKGNLPSEDTTFLRTRKGQRRIEVLKFIYLSWPKYENSEIN